jgi:hypothetical protein
MKKVIFFFFAFFLIFQTANSKSYRIGDQINNEIEFYKKYNAEISGKWLNGKLSKEQIQSFNF